MNYTTYLTTVDGSKFNDMIDVRTNYDTVEKQVNLLTYIAEFAKYFHGIDTDDPDFSFTEDQFEYWLEGWVISTTLEQLRREGKIFIRDAENSKDISDLEVVWVKLKDDTIITNN